MNRRLQMWGGGCKRLPLITCHAFHSDNKKCSRSKHVVSVPMRSLRLSASLKALFTTIVLPHGSVSCRRRCPCPDQMQASGWASIVAVALHQFSPSCVSMPR